MGKEKKREKKEYVKLVVFCLESASEFFVLTKLTIHAKIAAHEK